MKTFSQLMLCGLLLAAALPALTWAASGAAASAESVDAERTRTVQPPETDLPLRPWMRAFRQAELDESQRRELSERYDEYRTSRREYFEKHLEAIRELREQVHKAAQEGDSDQLETLNARMRELLDNAPNQEKLKSDLWDMLNDRQREQFRDQLARQEQRMQDRRREAAQQARRTRERADLDNAARRRLRFLRQHQLRQLNDRPGVRDRQSERDRRRDMRDRRRRGEDVDRPQRRRGEDRPPTRRERQRDRRQRDDRRDGR